LDVDLDGDEDLVGQSGNELWQSSLDPAGVLTPPAALSPPWLIHSGADLCAWDWDQDGVEELIVIKDALLTWWEPSPTGLALAGSYGLNPAPVEEIAWTGVTRRLPSDLWWIRERQR
jgi:hypothetical protein